MRHDLAGRNDEVVAFVHHAAVDLHAERLMPEVFGDFFEIRSRDFADLDHIMPPVMDEHFLIRNALEHDLPLRFGNRLMCSERGHNIDLCAALGQQMIIDACNSPCLRMKPREIRRDNENLFERSPLQRFQEGFF